MVDVVFLLLIFFMISTTFVETPGISIRLPESSSQQVEKAPEEIKVVLTAEGKILLEGETVSIAGLRQRLQAFGTKAAATTFILEADEGARHGRVVELMDAAREAGFSKLAIATEPRRER
jgi:biopolymer transport protein ExbD